MYYVFHSELNFKTVYDFLVVVSVVALLLIAFADSLFHKQLGFVFLFIISFKLIAAGIFIKKFPLIIMTEYKISFIVLYLISIVLITIFATRLLLHPKK